MEDLNLIFRNGQPLFEAYGCEGVMLRFDEIVGTVIPTPGDADGDTITMWGYLTVVLESEQKLLPLSSAIGKNGHVGWCENGVDSHMKDKFVLAINQAIENGQEISLNEAIADFCQYFYMLPPFRRWQCHYDFDYEEFQEKKKLVNGYNVELIKKQ